MLNVRISEELYRKIKEVAERRKVSVSELVRGALEEHVRRTRPIGDAEVKKCLENVVGVIPAGGKEVDWIKEYCATPRPVLTLLHEGREYYPLILILKSFERAGVRRVCVMGGYGFGLVRRVLESNLGLLEYFHRLYLIDERRGSVYVKDGSKLREERRGEEERELCGTGGTLLLLKELLEDLNESYDTLLVNYGDILHDIDLRELVRRHLALKSSYEDLLGTIAVSTNADLDFGAVMYRGGLVERFEERPVIGRVAEGWGVNIGVAVLEKGIFAPIEGLRRAGGGLDLFGSVIPWIVKRGRRVGVYLYRGEWIDVGLKVKQHQEKYPFIRELIERLKAGR